MRLWHGGVPGLVAGDLVEPGHPRRAHPGCPTCEARARGEHGPLEPATGRPDRVYATEHRLYAKFHASLWGRGDLYRVEPLDGDELEASTEDAPDFGCWTAPALRVVAVVDRAVLLTDAERRRLWREWSVADGVDPRTGWPLRG